MGLDINFSVASIFRTEDRKLAGVKISSALEQMTFLKKSVQNIL